jgi:hypothetical protein
MEERRVKEETASAAERFQAVLDRWSTRPKLIAAMLTYGVLIVSVLVVIGRLVARRLSRDA